jgi:hypothetical protein
VNGFSLYIYYKKTQRDVHLTNENTKQAPNPDSYRSNYVYTSPCGDFIETRKVSKTDQIKEFEPSGHHM